MTHEASTTACDGVNCQTMLLIVVGAHLRAEIEDRPLAYRLRDRLREWIAGNGVDSDQTTHLVPTVCTDIWYLNNAELQERPVICVGEPGVNAATAYLSTRLPTALMIDHTFRIHLDPDPMNQPQACLWGVNSTATAAAINAFTERYLDDFLREAVD